MPSLRVLQVIGSLHIGGAEKVVIRLARGLAEYDTDVAVLCTRGLGVLADRARDESIDVRLVAPRRHCLRHFTPLMLWRTIARFRPDVIHTHGTTALLHTGPLSALGLLPAWVHTFHYGNYGSKDDRQMRTERALCRHATRLVAVSEAQRGAVMRYHGVQRSRIVTVMNGVESNTHFEDLELRKRKRAELGIAREEIVVGTVAVLSEQKGVTYLLQAAPQVLACFPQARFLVVGGGPLEGSLRAEASSLGLGSRAVFTGWREDSLELLPCVDVFVMASLWEALPMVLLEAMAARRPIVVTDVGDNRLVVDEGRCGRLVQPRDPDAIAAAVIDLLGDPAEAESLATRAFERFQQRFTTQRMVTEYHQLYRHVA